MDEYHVPKEKASVLIAMPPRQPEPRYVFLSSCAQNHKGAETPSEIFNLHKPFVPLFQERGEVLLARHDAITWVMVSEPQRVEWYYYESRAGFPDARVFFEFDTGTRLDGRVALIGPAGARRVLDVINRQEGFLHVERGDELFLVNLKRVASITPKAD